MSGVRGGHGRRRFLGMGVACGCSLVCPRFARSAGAEGTAPPPAFDDKVGYCCATCTPEACDWLSPKMEVKRKLAAELEKKLGKKVDPERITCSRCRVDDESAFESIRACPIRRCVIERKLVSCAHCAELPACTRANPVTREHALALRQQLIAGSRREAR